VQVLEQGVADDVLALQLDLEPGTVLYHSVIVHFENDIPIQVEDRWVNPACAPDYLEQDFTHLTPNEYLSRTAPLQGAVFSIEALAPPPEIATMLAIDPATPCLVLRRRTRALGRNATSATMWSPGHR
jgi:GntR family histidine utilization transcriptional repressor